MHCCLCSRLPKTGDTWFNKHDKDLYQEFDAHAYTNMINTYKQQPEVVKAMDVLEPEEK